MSTKEKGEGTVTEVAHRWRKAKGNVGVIIENEMKGTCKS
jgi:hypothetical protein